MSFSSTNPVSIGDPTRKTDYDRAFDNTLALQDGTAELDAVDIHTGATTSSLFHYGEAADEGGWFTSTDDSTLHIYGGAEDVAGTLTARVAECKVIKLLDTGVWFYYEIGQTPGAEWAAPILRLYVEHWGILGLYEDFVELTEISDPDAPAANKVLWYARDNGGKTELVARFPTGAIQQIAIEP